MLTDRTRIVTYQRCPRLRFLTNHMGGWGLVPTLSSYELEFGRAYHAAISDLWVASRTLEDPDPDNTIIERDWLALRATLEAGNWVPPSAQWWNEQEFLFKGLLWAWVLVRRPLLLERYEIVMREREFLWNLSPTIQLMVRLDTLIRELTGGSLYYMEQKTTAWGNERWEADFEHNAQVMSGLLACEEALGEIPEAVLIEGHVKGPRRLDTALSSPYRGSDIQDSPLCYVWQMPDASVSVKWIRGATRSGLWEFTTPRDWVTSGLNASEREALFRVLMPIRPDRRHLDRWRRQTVAQETRVEAGLTVLGTEGLTDLEVRGVLDDTFPLYEGSCHMWGKKCSHWAFCHDSIAAQQPLAVPGFVRRTPHHTAELNLQNPPTEPA